MLSATEPENRKFSCVTITTDAAQVLVGHRPQGTPASSTVALGRVVEPGHQLGDRRLARAGLADQRHGLPCRDGQVEVRQHDRAVRPSSGTPRPRTAPRGRRPRQAATAAPPARARPAPLRARRRSSPARRPRPSTSWRTWPARPAGRRTGAGTAGTPSARPVPARRARPGTRPIASTAASDRLPTSRTIIVYFASTTRASWLASRNRALSVVHDRLVAGLAAERLHRAHAVHRLDELHDDLRDAAAGLPGTPCWSCPVEPARDQQQRHEPGEHEQRERQVEADHQRPRCRPPKGPR